MSQFPRSVTPTGSESDLRKEWLATLQAIGPLYPGMAFKGTEVDRETSTPRIYVIAKGNDEGATAAGRKAAARWHAKIQDAATKLSSRVGWRYTFGVKS